MNNYEKIQRNSNDILIISTDEEELFRKKFKDLSTDRKCTICDKKINEFYPHPALRVIVCADCFQFYDNTVFLSNKDGTDKNCRWCAKLSQKYCCTNCTVVFCPDCMNRNFKSNYVDVHVKNNPDWQCMICNQKQLWALRAQCANANNKTDASVVQSKARLRRADREEEEDDNTSDSISDLDEIPSELNKQLTATEMAEARGIFEPSRKNFDRLIDKIKIHCAIFSAVTTNRELKNAKDVLELTKKVSCMCRCIQDVITWIDGCNKSAYKEWFNKNISSINNNNKDEDDNKESRKTKTKDILQSLRLNKTKEESQEASGVSENFMNFLDEVQNEIKKEQPGDGNIKVETVSVFSKNTQTLKQNSPEKQKRNEMNLDDSKTMSFMQNGNLELQNRILSDFDDENIELKTVEYLCDKTGDIFEGFEILNSGNTTPIIFKDEPEDELEFDENEVYENIEDFFEIVKTEDDTCDEKKMEIFSYSPELMNLLNIKDESVTNKDESETDKDESGTDEDEVETDEDESETDENEVDTKLQNEIEQEKDLLYKFLMDSDCSTSISSLSSTSSSSSDKEDAPESDETKRGHIQILDIENELQKLRNTLPEIQSNQKQKTTSETCEVRLTQLDLDKFEKIANTKYGYRIPSDKKTIKSDASDSSSKSKDSKDSDDSDDEINKLINFKNLNKRKRSEGSSDSSASVSKRKSTKKKKYKSKSECETSSSSSDESKSDESDDLLSKFDIPDGKSDDSREDILKELVSNSNSDSDFSNDNSSLSSSSTTECEELEKNDKTNDKKKKKSDKKREIPAWKKDPILRGRFDVSTTDKNNKSNSNKNEINDETMEELETKFLEKSEIKKNKDDNDDDNETIILSDTSESEQDTESDADSDLIFISNKRKKGEKKSPNEKGRKNIRKVLDDSELQTETQIAHLEEEERKERISMKNKAIDAVLSQSSLSEEDIGLVLDVDETTKTPLVKIPQVLINPLKPHQIDGIRFMWDVCFESVNLLKSSAGAGCILAHCMGLGKTMQIVVLAYTLLTHKVTGLKHALILCPLSTVFNWCNEFKQTLKNAPEPLNVFDLRSDKHRSFREKIFEVKKWQKDGGVLIMGYDSFTSLVNEKKLKDRVSPNYHKIVLDSLIDPGPDIVVCDEGHILKSSKTHKFLAIDRVRTKRRIILTGTPLQNNLKEYWHMVSFVKPHLLGTYKEYSNRFVNPIVNGQYEDSSPMDIQLMKKRSHVLHKKLKTTVNRYELSELKKYLPPKHEYVLFIQLSELQIKLYKTYLEKIAGTNRNLFQNFHDLQNIWTHPALLHRKYEKRKTYDEDFDPNLDPDTVNSQHSGNSVNENWYKDHIPSDLSTNISYGSKIVILFSIIRETCALNEKLLVFSSSIQELDLIEEILLKSNEQNWTKNENYYRMDGSVLPEKRMQYCNAFNEKNNKRAKLFLISHKVGGLGLNLIAANRVVLMDVNWNPAYDTQSVFRVYRFGQEKPCFIYRLVSLGTMEELVYSRAVTKLAISCRVIDEQQIRRHFKEDDQHKLYKLNTDYLDQEPITPNLPSDRLLANLWGKHKPVLYNFKDHQSMLENLTHEELNEEEMKIAWEEFNREEEMEKTRLIQIANARELYKLQCQAMPSGGFIQHNAHQMPFIPINSNQNHLRLANLTEPSTSTSTVFNTRPTNSTVFNTRPTNSTVFNTRSTNSIVLNARSSISAALNAGPSTSNIPNIRSPNLNVLKARPSISNVSNIRPPNPNVLNARPLTSSVLNARPSTPNNAIPHPIGKILKTKQVFHIRENPFYQKNKQNEIIVPDIIPNSIPAHTNNYQTVPSTSIANLPTTQSYNINNAKKVYGDPKVNLNQDATKQKQTPQLIPTTNRNENIELFARNGVRITSTKKTASSETQNRFNNQLIETIDLE